MRVNLTTLWAILFVSGVCLLMGSYSAGAAEKPDDKKPAKRNTPKNADDYEDEGLCPVCHAEHHAKIHTNFGGRTYHFDSGDCKREFKDNPEFYLTPPAVEERDANDLQKIPKNVSKDIPKDIPKNIPRDVPKAVPKGPSK